MKADLFSGLAEPNEKPVCQKGDDSTARRDADAVAGSESGADCALCIDGSPVYDFGLVCCRVRFILSVPVLDVRRTWLERWKKREGEMSELIESEVRRRWRGEAAR